MATKENKSRGFWARRRGAIPFIVIATLIVVVLFLNEETSVKTNMEFEGRIDELKAAIQTNKDSAIYYREHRKAIENGESDLDHIARENFHLQKPTEDVFVYEQ